jgi:NNP family nitrate/nitrite transporter-like MFS transporter
MVPARQVGLAEGIYGGWGNFGSAAAAIVLPTLALAFGGADGWRYAFITAGAVSFLYGIFSIRSSATRRRARPISNRRNPAGLKFPRRGTLCSCW